MATSIHDLLDTANLHATQTDPTPAGLADAATAIGHLGRALRLLVNDGLSHDIGGYRERFVAELATACTAAARNAAFGGTRLSLLCGATADLVGILRPEWDHPGRWAAALAITETTRHVTAVLDAAENPETGPELAHLRRTTALVERTGAIEPPTARQAWLLDRPLPSPVAFPEDRVGGAIIALAHHTRPGTNLSVAEVLAVCIAAETTCRHTPVSEESEPALADAAADAWQQVRTALRPINDGSRQRHDAKPPVVAAAIRLHDTVMAGRTDASSSDDPGLLSGIHTAIQLLPAIAEQLRQQVQQWPATGRLRTYAADLPSREDRVGQQLAGHRPEGLIHVDNRDLTPVLRALDTAESTTAALSIAAAPAGPGTSGIPTGPLQRLTTANRQRLTDWRTEPRPTAPAHVPHPPDRARLHVPGPPASRPR